MEEIQYINIIKDLLNQKNYYTNRTDVRTKSQYGNMMKFSLMKENKFVLPVITSRKINIKNIIGELLWFVSGSTDVEKLKNQNINIWNKNSSKEYLKKVGLEYSENDIGPGYGFQWRYFGAKYIDNKTDYSGQGFDQLFYVINEIKNNPNSRRIIMSAWNPLDIKKMALPPCHILAHFLVKNNKLTCILYQRSCDMGLGVPYNLTSYSLLTQIIAKICDVQPYELIYMMGDCHIYETHETQLKQVVNNTIYDFPTIDFEKKPITEYNIKDFTINNYKSNKHISMEMVE